MICSITLNRLYCYWDKAVMQSTHHRLIVLVSVANSQYQVRSMLKEKASLLQKHDEYLFGKKFRTNQRVSYRTHKKPFSFTRFFIRKIFIRKWTSKTQKLFKMLKKSPGSNACAAIFRNVDFSWSSLKVSKLSKF